MTSVSKIQNLPSSPVSTDRATSGGGPKNTPPVAEKGVACKRAAGHHVPQSMTSRGLSPGTFGAFGQVRIFEALWLERRTTFVGGHVKARNSTPLSRDAIIGLGH